MKQLLKYKVRKYLYLRAQLENSEKIRLETETTVEILREEFELLVKVT